MKAYSGSPFLIPLALIAARPMQSQAQARRMQARDCPATAPAAAPNDSISADIAAATFDAVVRIVGRTHFDSAAVGRSWLERGDSLRDEALDRATGWLMTQTGRPAVPEQTEKCPD